ncbi:MAG: hypothetical protein NTW29_14450 [Bacteroidetes bacterium]|nr:hypothetical protein [Bacteroidota bacterium]
MNKNISWVEKQSIGSSLTDLGFRDYIAARFLLNNGFFVQGLTLASTAIEKYLKAVLVFSLKEKERYNYHLDNIGKLKALLEKHHYDVTKKIDPVFLNIIQDAYKIRYYDNLKKPIKIGFFLNQLIGELDNTIHNIELSEVSGLLYKQAIKEKNSHLYNNNFILNKQDKKAYMESPDTAIYIYIQIGTSLQNEKKVVGYNVVNKYEGRLAIFNDPSEVVWHTGQQ